MRSEEVAFILPHSSLFLPHSSLTKSPSRNPNQGRGFRVRLFVLTNGFFVLTNGFFVLRVRLFVLRVAALVSRGGREGQREAPGLWEVQPCEGVDEFCGEADRETAVVGLQIVGNGSLCACSNEGCAQIECGMVGEGVGFAQWEEEFVGQVGGVVLGGDGIVVADDGMVGARGEPLGSWVGKDGSQSEFPVVVYGQGVVPAAYLPQEAC